MFCCFFFNRGARKIIYFFSSQIKNIFLSPPASLFAPLDATRHGNLTLWSCAKPHFLVESSGRDSDKTHLVVSALPGFFLCVFTLWRPFDCMSTSCDSSQSCVIPPRLYNIYSALGLKGSGSGGRVPNFCAHLCASHVLVPRDVLFLGLLCLCASSRNQMMMVVFPRCQI